MTYDNGDKVVLVEGIYDYYCFDMFLPGYKFIPCRNASSVVYYIALMIGWGISFNVIWDNDEEGIDCKNRALHDFGDVFCDRFHLLPGKGNQKAILQDMFAGNDLVMIREELQLPSNTSFDRTIYSLYYDSRKDGILSKISSETKNAFSNIDGILNF